MKKNRVQSSNIKKVGYNPDTLLLEIEFRGGVRYVYKDVPASVYEFMLRIDQAGGSIGEWFHENIREAGYEYYKVPKGERVI